MKSLSKEIRAYTLKNAIENDRAILPKILPKLFQHGLQKKDIKTILPEINEAIKEILEKRNSE